jgi:hypothetical protein
VIRWENTIAPWLIEQGFERGSNEPCAFWEPNRDLLALLYVDDVYEDGEEDDIVWSTDNLATRFKCKDTEWLTPSDPLDYLGMYITQDEHYTYMSMERYILDTVRLLGYESLPTASTPICDDIDAATEPLNSQDQKHFMTAVGCLGWLVNTCRPDVAYAHSRIAQHMATPTVAALQAVCRCFRYLKGTADYGIRSPRYTEHDADAHWRFYCDSDFAGNSEPGNSRRSQNGFVAMLNGAPVLWGSKVSSVAFASPDIGEAHADMSSTAAEIYAAANATVEFLHLSYIADEMNIPFPKPFKLHIDNAAAIVFAEHTAFKSKLKHIDTRQEWVKKLRDRGIVTPVKVPTCDNLADLFTKILSVAMFCSMRDRMMIRVSKHV